MTHTSIPFDPELDIDSEDRVRAVFYGLGADGTVGANKNSIKIIGEETDNDAQGYFVYDSKKSGAVTISHLRFGPGPIRSAYLIRRASFVACHQFGFLDKFDILECASPGAVFLLNAPYGAAEVFDHLPREVQEQILDKKLRSTSRRVRWPPRPDGRRITRSADLILRDLRVRPGRRRSPRYEASRIPPAIRVLRRAALRVRGRTLTNLHR